MRPDRLVVALLALTALMCTALPSAAGAAKVKAQGHRHPHGLRRTVVLHRRIPSPGVYLVHVTVSTRSLRRGIVAVRIGRHARHLTTVQRTRRSQFTVRVTICGHSLAIRAFGRRE